MAEQFNSGLTHVVSPMGQKPRVKGHTTWVKFRCRILIFVRRHVRIFFPVSHGVNPKTFTSIEINPGIIVGRKFNQEKFSPHYH